jgi:uncharacterized protein (TIGR03067 family)
MSEASPNLEGHWQMVRAEWNGEAAPELVTRETQLEFTAAAYVVRYAGQVMDQGRYEWITEETSRHLVLHGTQGTNAGRRIPCLCQLVGDRLRICYGLDGTRPTDFGGGPDRQRYVAGYRRTDATRSG